ncbi:hypothetical protein WME91_32090 [Sorangium sp. So ce269]
MAADRGKKFLDIIRRSAATNLTVRPGAIKSTGFRAWTEVEEPLASTIERADEAIDTGIDCMGHQTFTLKTKSAGGYLLTIEGTQEGDGVEVTNVEED